MSRRSGRSSAPKDMMAMYPRRLRQWEEKEGNLVVVFLPRFGSRAGKKIGGVFGTPEHYNVKLDELGSFVWLRCDGKTQARDMLAAMRGRFGDKIEPAAKRLGDFLKEMAGAELAELLDAPAEG